MTRIFIRFPTYGIEREDILNAAEVEQPDKNNDIAILQTIIEMCKKYGLVVVYEDTSTNDVYVAGYRDLKGLIKDVAYAGGQYPQQELMEVYVDREADAKITEYYASLHIRSQWIRA